MKISLNWLREYVELPAEVPELVDLLTLAGVEVEGVLKSGVAIPQVVVARIQESTQHPNADRLSVCKVDDGSGVPRQIVCGAKNYQVGDKVPLALPGAVLPGDFKIKVGKLRGVESEGMLCSAEELGLPKGADGLLILPADAVNGSPFSDLFPGDTVLDLEVTPNRPDLLSHIGIAREVAALTGKEIRLPMVTPVTGDDVEPVSVEAPECPLYTVLAISGVKVGPSPDWLKRKLEAVGLRPINTVVDVTNFVMLETGQPLHAFDADKLDGGIRVRMAGEGEEFLALDERTYTLAPTDVVIADAKSVLALAGVMGGKNSGVTMETRNILLESACFEAAEIRRTSRRLGLSSDSSYRFERGVDAAGVLTASQRATALLVELTRGTPCDFKVGMGEGSAFSFDQEGFKKQKAGLVFSHCVALRFERIAALLGTEIPAQRVDEILSGFGLRKTETGWEIPSFRQDLTREVDLIEEIARVIGLEKIPGRVVAAPSVRSAADGVYDFDMALRLKLAGLGLSEARTSTLVSAAMLWQGAPAIRLRNPLGEDQAFLRTSLLPGLLGALELNIRQGAKNIGLYEIGRTFPADVSTESDVLAVILHGQTSSGGWRGEQVRALDWHDAKGIFETLGPASLRFQKIAATPPLALAAEALAEGRRLGVLGQLSPAAARSLDTRGPVLTLEISLEALREFAGRLDFQDIPKFPVMTRDLALACPLQLAYAEIEDVLREAKEELLARVEPFDVFTDPSGEKLPADRKSIAISLTFRAAGRTLNSEEVNAACERLKQGLKAKLAVDFRE